MPNPAHPLVPLPGQVWLQSPLMQAAGTGGSGACTLRVLSNKHHKGLTKGDSRIQKREEQTAECI